MTTPLPPAELPVRTVELSGRAGLASATGTWLGRSEWLRLEPDALTSHIAPELLVLAAAGAAVPRVVQVLGRRHGLNYGLDDVRFHARLRAGDPLRVAVRLDSADAASESAVDVRWQVAAERDHDDPLLLTATVITRYVF